VEEDGLNTDDFGCLENRFDGERRIVGDMDLEIALKLYSGELTY